MSIIQEVGHQVDLLSYVPNLHKHFSAPWLIVNKMVRGVAKEILLKAVFYRFKIKVCSFLTKTQWDDFLEPRRVGAGE